MTREEALVKVRGYLTDLIPSEDYNEVEEIMSALEQQPCGDCISRQAVLDLAESGKLVSNGNYKSVCDAINGLPSVEPEKCGDCISRRAIIGKCEDTAKATSESGEINTGFIMALDFIADYAKHLPSVEQEKIHGKWLSTIHHCRRWVVCSQCRAENIYDRSTRWNYCPSCGAKMEVNK